MVNAAITKKETFKILICDDIAEEGVGIFQKDKNLTIVTKTKLPLDALKKEIADADAIYANPDDAMTNWDVEDLRSWFERAGLTVATEVESTIAPLQISSAAIERWFSNDRSKPTYADYLSKFLSAPEIAIVQQTIEDRLLHQTVDWYSKSAVIIAKFDSGAASPTP